MQSIQTLPARSTDTARYAHAYFALELSVRSVIFLLYSAILMSLSSPGSTLGSKAGSHLHWEMILQKGQQEIYLGRDVPNPELYNMLNQIFKTTLLKSL